MRFYRPKNLKIQNIVDAETFKMLGERAWQLFDADLLYDIDNAMISFFGQEPIINNWLDKGFYKYSGFRPVYCTEGAILSQHRLGNAFDLKFKAVQPKEVFKLIYDNSELWPSITCMEAPDLTPTWTHIDGRNIDTDKIYIIKKA